MNIPRTSLLLALLSALAPATHAADLPDAGQAKELAPVRVEGQTHDDRHGTALDAYGNASLHDTPAAVTLVTRKQLDDRQIRTLSELAREDASLGDNYAPVGYYQNIAIRGYPLDLATGLRLNNLAIAGEQPVALEDKQRVEVLKGLAGLQAGVMEPGGVVNFVSKRPADVREVTLGTDSHGSRYGALDLGGWLGPNIGLRANLAWEDIHSYVRHADGRRNFYALAADWHITPDATLELDSDYQASAQRSVSGYQLLGGDTIPKHADPTRLLGYQPWQQPVSIHAANTGARFNYALSEDWRLRLAAGHSRSVIDDNVAFAYGCFYATGCASGEAPGNFFAPNGDYDIYDFRSPDDTRIDDEARATLEGRFDTGAVSQQLTLGASAFRRLNDQRADVYDYVGTGNIADLDPPRFAPSPNQPGASVRRLTSWQRSLFALDRLHLGERWQLLAGARLVRLHERAYDGDGTLERDTRLSRTLPQAAVLWQPVDPLTAYISYSEGLSLGREAPYWTSNDSQMLPPRLSRQLEAGLKYATGGAFDLSAALFRIRQPYQFARPDDSAAGFTFVQQGEQVHTGLELGAHGRVSDNLGITASASLIRARAQDTGIDAYERHQVVNVPRLRATVHAEYRLPFAPQLSLLGGWRYASANAATPDGRVRVDAYHVFDAGLRYAATVNGHALTARLSVDNLFDRFYWRDTGSALGDSYLFPGAPRLARLSVSIAF
ncbi:TonB-dependent siderophore receptor [Frateuria hangzhouensis]|uniref:TonB-dependent siderophore receptor n=1 Tax=Frateuria hangzhouensis TaxID=2995589 RepID=UPI002260CAFD|nr:TonB-dependent siderophore receptor [Frateuria sp. STR12]MCX7513511.1 TonB-dependent siderophore receptor [Frateuria sp. STR12]